MKRKIQKLITVLLTALTLAACGGGGSDYPGPPLVVTDDGISTISNANLNYAIALLPLESLNNYESSSLVFMREEEKLAYNVYSQLNNTWGAQTRVFGSISQSEASHTEAVRLLLVRYSLADPAANLTEGVFENQTLQQLYANLIQQGNLSYLDALKVGCAIEEIDILDLQNALVNVDNQDIRIVYDNLTKGSRNHLRSFVNALTVIGVTYVPQYLTTEAYTAIISTPIERGN
jgi:hypothetical protein